MPLLDQSEAVTMTPRDRLFLMHATCCLAALCFGGFFQFRARARTTRIVFPLRVAKCCFDFATVVFVCETVWLLNFFHCVTADRTPLFPVGFSSKAVTYGSALAAATLLVI